MVKTWYNTENCSTTKLMQYDAIALVWSNAKTPTGAHRFAHHYERTFEDTIPETDMIDPFDPWSFPFSGAWLDFLTTPLPRSTCRLLRTLANRRWVCAPVSGLEAVESKWANRHPADDHWIGKMIYKIMVKHGSLMDFRAIIQQSPTCRTSQHVATSPWGAGFQHWRPKRWRRKRSAPRSRAKHRAEVNPNWA